MILRRNLSQKLGHPGQPQPGQARRVRLKGVSPHELEKNPGFEPKKETARPSRVRLLCFCLVFLCSIPKKKGYRKKSRKSLFLLGRQWFRICFCGPKLQSTTCFCCDSGYVSPGFMVNDLDFCCHNYSFSASTRRPWGPGPSKINTSKRQGVALTVTHLKLFIHLLKHSLRRFSLLRDFSDDSGFFCFCQCDISWPLPPFFCKLRPIFLWKMFNRKSPIFFGAPSATVDPPPTAPCLPADPGKIRLFSWLV